MDAKTVLDVIFFCNESGQEPVRKWLKAMPRQDRKIIGDDIKSVQFRWPLGMPLVRKMDDALWEARSKITHGKICRVFFTVKNRQMVLLHGMIKKTDSTPDNDMDMARRRRNLWIKGERHGK